MMLKACSKCKVEKYTINFGIDARACDGLKSACKDCLRKQGRGYAKNRSINNGDLLNARTREWRDNKIIENPNYYKEQYCNNHNKNLKKAKKYYNDNKNVCLDRQKKWKENNRNVYLQSSKNWKLNNPEVNKKIQKISSERYRARKINATIQNFSYQELDQRMSMFGHKCSYCDGLFEHIDHVISLSKGGKHCLSNLRPSCQQCNNKKFNKSPIVWFTEIKGK